MSHFSFNRRSLRLFACACCRAVWPLIREQRSRRAVEVAEKFADGTHSADEWGAAHNDAVAARVDLRYETDAWHAAAMAENTVLTTANVEAVLRDQTLIQSLYPNQAMARRLQATLLRDIVGNPFAPHHRLYREEPTRRPGPANGPHTRLVPVVPWLTPTSRGLAQTAYDERAEIGTIDCDRLAVLADALEEAGCDSEDMLAHLRSTGPHYRGCWALDIVAGR